MKIIAALFETLTNWLEKKATPSAAIMQERVEREKAMQLNEAELDRLRHLRKADEHRGAAESAARTIARLRSEGVQ